MSEHFDIQAVHVFKLSIPFKEEYSNNKNVETIVVNIRTDAGHSGWGSATINPDDIDKAHDDLKERISPALIDSNPSNLGRIFESVSELTRDNPALKASLDIALFDIWGKYLNAPLDSILGSYRDDIPTSIAVMDAEPIKMIESIKKYKENGLKSFRLAPSAEPDEKLEFVNAASKEISHISFRLSVSSDCTIKKLKSLLKHTPQEIELIEIQTDEKNIDEVMALSANSPAPVTISGNIKNAREAFLLFEKGCPMLTVRLMNCGGLAETIRICEAARMTGRKIHIGCTNELPISLTAAAHIALSQQPVAYADLDGHLCLDQHTAGNGLIIADGKVSVPDTPGLGIEIRKHYLR